MFHQFRRQGANFGRRVFTQTRSLSSVPLYKRHPQPFTPGKILAVSAAIVIGYCGYDRFAGQAMIDFEKKRIAQREVQFQLRDIKSRGTDTKSVVSKLLESNAEPVDWDTALDALKESSQSAIRLQVSADNAEGLLEGRAGVITVDVDDSWTQENTFAKILETVAYPIDDHPTENFEERFFAVMQRLSRNVRAPAVLLVKGGSEDVLAKLQEALNEPAFGGAYGVYVVGVQQ